jgi:hypothetical protein
VLAPTVDLLINTNLRRDIGDRLVDALAFVFRQYIRLQQHLAGGGILPYRESLVPDLRSGSMQCVSWRPYTLLRCFDPWQFPVLNALNLGYHLVSTSPKRRLSPTNTPILREDDMTIRQMCVNTFVASGILLFTGGHYRPSAAQEHPVVREGRGWPRKPQLRYLDKAELLLGGGQLIRAAVIR